MPIVRNWPLDAHRPSGYSRYASSIPHTPILTLCPEHSYPIFSLLRSPFRPYCSFPPCSLCGSQVSTILLVAPQHSSLVPFIPFTPSHPTIAIAPLRVTPPSSVFLVLLLSIFLLYAQADLHSSRYFQFVPAFWILSIRLCSHSGWPLVDLITYTHGQVLVYSASCILYIIPSPCHVLCIC